MSLFQSLRLGCYYFPTAEIAKGANLVAVVFCFWVVMFDWLGLSGAVLWDDWLVFAGLMAVAQLSPGPDMVLLTRTALTNSVRVGFAMSSGIASGLVIHALLALTGASVLMQSNVWLWRMILVIAAIYLFWLAAGMFRGGWAALKGRNEQDGKSEVLTYGQAWQRGVLCNILNGKAMVAISVMTLPFAAKSPALEWKFALFSVLVFQALIFWCGWVLLLRVPQVRVLYRRYGGALDLVFGLGLVILGVALFFEMDGVSS